MELLPCDENFVKLCRTCYNSSVTDSMAGLPTLKELSEALSAAGSAHHEYEQTVLHGVRHEEWAVFYAPYVLGRLGDFVQPSVLTRLLNEAPLTENWAETAAAHVLSGIKRGR